MTMTMIRNLGGAVAIALTLTGTAEAFSLKAPGPQPGQCKVAPELGMGASAAHAQAHWSAIVAAKFTDPGGSWAAWYGAKDRKVFPIPTGNGGVIYQAIARPCFYPPVP